MHSEHTGVHLDFGFWSGHLLEQDLGKIFNLTQPKFSNLYNGDNYSIYPIGLMVKLK